MAPLILFDIGEVLVRVDFARFARFLSTQSERSEKEILEEFLGDHTYTILDIGDREGFCDAIRTLADNGAIADDDIIAAYCTIHHESIPSMIALKEELMASGATVGILSNSHASVRAHAESLWPGVFRVNGPHIYSDEVRLVKPDPRIFALADAEEVILIDDNRKNIVAAHAMGWTCIHFTQDSHARSAEGIHVARTADEVRHILKGLGLQLP